MLVNWLQDGGFTRWSLHGLDAADDGYLASVIGESRGGHFARIRSVGEGDRVGCLATAPDHNVTLHLMIENGGKCRNFHD